ncbi:MAG TPA: hypothetical protein VNA24_17750 [Hyalangium sp.]|jgi:hypothetical protein|nr:hypothetical protein [Hyalangium sp.]
MIRVHQAPEPPDFDERVRQPGLRAIAELVGGPVTVARPGPRRKVAAERRENLKPEDFPPLWREMTGSLLIAYGRICAYACLYIDHITGSATVDHWAPKSTSWERVYEWDNYRLSCSLMNTRKSTFGDVIDPFEVEEGLFALDLVRLKAVPGPGAGARESEVEATIQRLGLDGSDYAEALGHYYHDYFEGHISLQLLERRAPFLARELRRQGKLRPGDR